MAMTVVETLPVPVAVILGPEHALPFPCLPGDFATRFTAVAPSQCTAFLVFQQRLAQLGLDEFPYRPPTEPSHDPSCDDTTDQKNLLTEWKDSPWHKECFWSEDFQALQQRLFKAKKSLSVTAMYQAFTSLNLCGQEITNVDCSMTVLRCLTRLSLADNRLMMVDLDNLPSTLQHLELYGNFLKEIRGYAPKGLRHLGVAANQLTQLTSLLSKARLDGILSMDVGENFLQTTEDMTSYLVSPQFNRLQNLRAAGNPSAFTRSYRKTLVGAIPTLLCLDGVEVLQQAKQDHLEVSYDNFILPSTTVTNQTIVLVTLDSITGGPFPQDYIKPEDQWTYPLIKWVYGLEISFPGEILNTKPALPPPTPEELKAKTDKAAKELKKSKNKGKRTGTPVLVEVAPEPPEDPLYTCLSVPIHKVQNEGVDWVYADPLQAKTYVPLLTSTDLSKEQLYEYFRRGIRVKLLLRRVLYTPEAVGGKKAPKVPKGSKANPWDIPLTPEVAETTTVDEFVIPSVGLLHGHDQVTFQCQLHPPAVVERPPTPVKKSNKLSPASKGGKGKAASKSPSPLPEPVVQKGPMVITVRVALHHDQSPADLRRLPPEIAPYVPPEPVVELKRPTTSPGHKGHSAHGTRSALGAHSAHGGHSTHGSLHSAQNHGRSLQLDHKSH